MPQPDWQSIENIAYQIIVNAVHSIRRQHPHETVYTAIFHNFYCDNTISISPRCRSARKSCSRAWWRNTKANTVPPQAVPSWNNRCAGRARIWRNICLTAARRATRRRRACKLPCAKKPIGTIYTTASANVFRAPAAVPQKTCCTPSSSPPILSPLLAMKTKN